MYMKFISLALCGVMIYFGLHYYKAIRHEFYEVWDSMDRRMGAEK
jgi:hypothetical protein